MNYTEGYVKALENATTHLINYEMVMLLIKAYKEKKITGEKALDCISRVVNNDATWLEVEGVRDSLR